MSGTLGQIRRAGAIRLATVGVLALVHRRALRAVRTAPPSSFLARILAERPEIHGMVLTPYLCAAWDAPTRIARVVDHCRIVERLGPAFMLTSRDNVRLVDLPQIGAGYHVRLESPRWMTRDGLLEFSLCDETRCMFTLAFSLAHDESGLVAYVGGVQGQRGDDMPDLYRVFTRAACGIRPRDLLIELFRMLCSALGIARIQCVSDANRHQRSAYAVARAGDPVGVDYDAIWRERGGTLRGDGFFDLPLAQRRREAEAVPANKRSLYRRRYAMLDEMEVCLRAAVHNRDALCVLQWGETGGSDTPPAEAGAWIGAEARLPGHVLS